MRLAIPLAVVGAALIALGRYTATGVQTEQTWPTVAGTVASSTTYAYKDFVGAYAEDVSYVVAGTTYHVTSHPRIDSPKVADPRTVRYDPANPADASIVGDAEAASSLYVTLGIALIAISLVGSAILVLLVGPAIRRTQFAISQFFRGR